MELRLSKTIAQAKLYVVATPAEQNKDISQVVEKVLAGGADVIQLRDKFSSAQFVLAQARKIKKMCQNAGALFIVNDRLDIALAAQADGVHLGQDDLPLVEAREIVQKVCGDAPFLIGRSTHSLAQALEAQAQGADYLGCGPVFTTPTKPDYQAQGLELVKQYRANIHIPFVAIGGIDETNAKQVVDAGAKCLAVVRAVMNHPQPDLAASSLKKLIS